MRVCIERSTGRLLEMQSHARAGTLVANAVRAGHAEADVEERVVSPAEYAALLAGQPPTLADVKARARAVILARYPEWKQQNMTARGVELQDLRHENGSWTPAEQAEAAALRQAWTWIKAVRARSDQLEAALAADQPVDLETGASTGQGGWPD